MSDSSVISVSQSLPIRRSLFTLIARWGLQVGRSHLFIVGGSPALPAALLMLGLLVVGWARRDRISRVLASVR